MNNFIDKVLEQEALVSKICELQRRLDMTERLMCDCILILCDEEREHRTVEYEEEDVADIGKSLIDVCYNIAKKRDEEKAAQFSQGDKPKTK